jgi:alpha-maltose-1-phosphate synthase
MPLKVLVSHPFRQHVHQLVYSLQKQGYLVRFMAGIWYKPQGRLTRILLKILPGLEKQLKRRYFAPLDENKILSFPFPELYYRLLAKIRGGEGEKRSFLTHRLHDRLVARHLGKIDFDILIGYENGVLESFRQAKKMGKITVLDLALTHHNLMTDLRNQYPAFRNVMKEDAFWETMNCHKDEELKYADYVLVLSDLARQTLLRAGFPEDKMYYINVGFNATTFRLKPAYHRNQKFQILFSGTLTTRKGVRLLLEAVRQLQLPDAELTLIGPVTDAAEVLKEYEGSYTYLPFLHHEELAEHLQAADIFVFPSYLDSWPHMIMEVMACGTPVIITENTGSKDAVREGGGFIIPIDDVAAIKEKILFFYHNRSELERMGREAHEIVQKYTWENYHRNLILILDDIARREKIPGSVTL